ncbi:MAG: hypothetical protein K0R57_2829 [Paenibacillaceae bacterium]|jgi:outer membrane biosynthesis protein TonB|nr:hypothetical protein [Paenibacillaceae bacterium]
MRKSNKRTWFLISGLAVIGLVLVLTLTGAFRDTPSTEKEGRQVPSPSSEQPLVITDIQTESSLPSQAPTPSVAVPEITSQPTATEAPILHPAATDQHIEVPLTQQTPTAKPTEPPKPKAEASANPQNPVTPPTYSKQETEPNQQKTEPKAGEKNSEGKVWFPGFGWVEDHGGNTQVTEVGKEGDELTGNKVGKME